MAGRVPSPVAGRVAEAEAGVVAIGGEEEEGAREGKQNGKGGSNWLIPCRDTPHAQSGGVTFIYIANMAGYTWNTIKYTWQVLIT
jgi:hypothetical protein